jgi:integrating conjugative element membrane protein (TIGR03747 family)
MVGLVDGLVKRDLRKWCGGRESSFVYHHSKNYTGWFLTGGLAIYLAWPFRGFDPTYMVLLFTVLVAASLSITVSSFKKYL